MSSSPQSAVSTARARPAKRSPIDLLTRHNDIALTGLIIAVIALMVLPLPPALLDTLIALNIAASLAMLMLSMYVPSAIGLSTFPSLLLFTTLFRLSLNIASTKQILLHANAGHIIDTFGKLVVGGNVVVGLVVFLIVAIVQFIVIAKGAERVAEVGARFTLDAMPGKQMSIDADLRAGIIDKEDARRRRLQLEQESQLHGAMDGAMKFVKGDAIAAIIIALVNIVAGIAIGSGMHDMPLAEAVSRYTILTVGDGMVSQIPSLFVSIAAGIIITRVAGGDEEATHLGGQIARQIISHPAALLASGAILTCFVFVPGFPKAQFLLLALLFGGTGYWLYFDRRRVKAFDDTVVPAMRRDGTSHAPALIDETPSALAVPLRIRLSPSLQARIEPAVFDAALEARKLELQRDLGLPFPGIRINYDAALPALGYAIDVQELCVECGTLQPDCVLLAGAETAAAGERPDAITDQPCGPFAAGTWLPRAGLDAELAAKALEPEVVLALHLAAAMRRHAEAFVGMQEVQNLITRVEAQIPDLSAEILRALPLQRIADVLRRLVQEGVSIRYLREIFESLIVWGTREKDIVMLTEYVRVDLGRFITRRLVDESDTLRAVLLDPAVEGLFRDAIEQGVGGSYLAMAPEMSAAVFEQAEQVLSRFEAVQLPVVLVSMDIRRYVKKFLSTRFPDLAVVSYQELTPEVRIEALHSIAVGAGSMREAA